MKYVVTGGAGFIGSNIARALVARGDEVIVIDNLFSGKKQNCADYMDKITFVEGSITDEALLKEHFVGVDFVIHQAAVPSVPRSVQDPLGSHDVNTTGTLKVLIAARDAGVKRVVFAGSSSVYGNAAALPKTEDMPPAPLSPYALQKLAGEIYCRQFAQLYDLDTVTLRYFNVFGPYQDPASAYAAVIPLFIKKILAGETPQIFGDGLQSRDFTFVDNVVHANLLACDAPGKLGGAVVNAACGQQTSLLELVKKINEILGTTLEPMLGEDRVGDVKHSLAAIGKAKSLIGYEPQVHFMDGLKKTVAWYKENGN